MNYMLDTDTCSYLMRQRALSVVQALHDTARQGHVIMISVITYQELRFGAHRKGAAKYHQLIDSICARLDRIADWTADGADRFAVLHAQLMEQGTPIGYTDTMIAAHALTLDAVLVSNNQKHFSKVPELSLENWVTT